MILILILFQFSGQGSGYYTLIDFSKLQALHAYQTCNNRTHQETEKCTAYNEKWTSSNILQVKYKYWLKLRIPSSFNGFCRFWCFSSSLLLFWLLILFPFLFLFTSLNRKWREVIRASKPPDFEEGINCFFRNLKKVIRVNSRNSDVSCQDSRESVNLIVCFIYYFLLVNFYTFFFTFALVRPMCFLPALVFLDDLLNKK